MTLVGSANAVTKIPGIHFPTTLNSGGGLFGAITQSPYTAQQMGVPGTSMQSPNPRPNLPNSSTDPTTAAIHAASSGAASTGQGNDVFNSYYAGDQALQDQLNQLQQQKTMLGTSYQTQAEQAAINYGAIPNLPTGYSDPSGLLAGALADGATQTAAANNPYSTTAQLHQQLTKANNTADANLVARGIYRSGELGQDHNLNTQGYDTASNSALQNFLGALSGYTNDYNTGLTGLSGQLPGFYNDATNRAISLINAGLLGQPASQGAGGIDIPNNISGSYGDSGGGGAAPYMTPNTPVYGPTPGAGQGDVGSGIAGLGGAAGGTYHPPSPPPPVSSGAGGVAHNGGTNYQAHRNAY